MHHSPTYRWPFPCSTICVSCPICGALNYSLIRSARELEQESSLRERFVKARLGHFPTGSEGMDLTQFMHGGPAEILACALCGTFRRNEEQPAHYESDYYDSALMTHLYPRYRDAFAQKRDHFQPLLRPGADVVELGSHLGAFLEIAETWGWKPIGLDIGRDTSAFTRRQGGSVRQVSLDDYSSSGRPDAVFIWNCFEQLDDPWATLTRARLLLARHGVVVLRVPNAEFYRQPTVSSSQRLCALGYNNLLGFPYLNGYRLEGLKRLLASTGFETIAAFATNLLTPPYPELDGELRKEWSQTCVATEKCGATNSPWMEIVGRSVPWS
jgi:Methyltransferase domain